jgi:hypothetical protein
MNCLTSCSSKIVLPVLLILVAGLWGCSGYKTELTVFLAQPGDAARQAATGEQDQEPAVGRDVLIAVLPPENLSGTRAPLDDIGRSISAGLARKGFRLLDMDLLEQFRKKYRMRYIGGVSTVLSEAMREEMGVDAILITSLESYNELAPPRISLISRLVSSGSRPEIIWIDSVGLSGNESPGLLGLNRIREPRVLLEKAVEQLTGSLAAHIDVKLAGAGKRPTVSGRPDNPGRLLSLLFPWKKKYLPYDFFRSPVIDPEEPYSIAAIPMLDLAVRKNAGIIVTLHQIRELFRLTDFTIMEPGVVREELLRFRAIMPAGPSLAISDLITGSGSLGVDLVLTGRVFDYQDSAVNPKVDFSIQVIEKQSREVVFGARTFSTGDKGVYFFDFGRVYTAHNLLAEMTRTTTRLLTARTRSRQATGGVLPLNPEGQNAVAKLAGTGFRIWTDAPDHPYRVVITNKRLPQDVF